MCTKTAQRTASRGGPQGASPEYERTEGQQKAT